MRCRSRRHGFTLVELMVVAAIIVCLLVVTVPAFKSMINSGQAAQSANIIRSTLLMVRDYALTSSVPAGVRFQDDGRIVPIYAQNAGQHEIDAAAVSYRNGLGGTPLPGQAGNPFNMYTIPAMAPATLPGAYRVIALDYTYTGLGPNWFGGSQWFLTSVILFSPRGRAIQAQVQFPANWAPSSGDATTSYSKWLVPVVYSYQGANSPATGPSVPYDLRIYDYAGTQAYLAVGATTDAATQIERSGFDFYLDANTGRMIRRGADLATDQ